MSNVVQKEQWLSVQSSEILEKRTYKNGQSRYYVQGSLERWGRVEKYWAEDHWLAKKFFVKEDEYAAIKKEESKAGMRKFWLSQAQRAGGVLPKWERK